MAKIVCTIERRSDFDGAGFGEGIQKNPGALGFPDPVQMAIGIQIRQADTAPFQLEVSLCFLRIDLYG